MTETPGEIRILRIPSGDPYMEYQGPVWPELPFSPDPKHHCEYCCGCWKHKLRAHWDSFVDHIEKLVMDWSSRG